MHQRRSRSRFEVEKHGQESGRKKERDRRGIVRHCRANEKKQVQKFNGDAGMKIKLVMELLNHELSITKSMP